MPHTKWTCLPFPELTTVTLYAILRLRSEVFVVEQNCVYQDMDGFDAQALHLVGMQDNELVGYARIFAPGIKYPAASIGRVVTAPAVRGTGLGRELMTEAVAYCDRTWPGQGITLSAQHHLEQFYNELGFRGVSEPYMEDGIPHIEMLRN